MFCSKTNNSFSKVKNLERSQKRSLKSSNCSQIFDGSCCLPPSSQIGRKIEFGQNNFIIYSSNSRIEVILTINPQKHENLSTNFFQVFSIGYSFFKTENLIFFKSIFFVYLFFISDLNFLQFMQFTVSKSTYLFRYFFSCLLIFFMFIQIFTKLFVIIQF